MRVALKLRSLRLHPPRLRCRAVFSIGRLGGSQWIWVLYIKFMPYNPTFLSFSPSDLVQGVALSTTAVMPFRFFAQTPFFSVSPSSFSLSPIWKYHHHHTPFCLLIVVSNASASFCQWLLHLWGGDQHRLVHLEPLGRAESGRCRTEILREIRCLLETKGSSCKESRPKHHPATSNRSDAMRWALKEYR